MLCHFKCPRLFHRRPCDVSMKFGWPVVDSSSVPLWPSVAPASIQQYSPNPEDATWNFPRLGEDDVSVCTALTGIPAGFTRGSGDREANPVRVCSFFSTFQRSLNILLQVIQALAADHVVAYSSLGLPPRNYGFDILLERLCSFNFSLQ